MLAKITQMLMNFCERRGRVLEITGTGGKYDVYLIRYYLVKSKYFNVFIHQFLRSDRDDLHDHPWDFATYLVRGAYMEKKWNPETGEVDRTVRQNYYNDNNFIHRRNARLVFRRAEDQHQVLVFRDLKREQKAEAPLTICVTGPTRREWGFIKERDPKHWMDELEPVELQTGKVREWIDWRIYLGLDKNAPGRG